MDKEKHAKLEAYFEKDGPFSDQLNTLRALALELGYTETLKWSMPVYMVDNKNVVGISAFKNHYGLWFFNGNFLKDPKSVLTNAQEGKTKGMRQWRFEAPDELNKTDIIAYLKEAMANQKAGLSLVPAKTGSKTIAMPEELQKALDSSGTLQQAFDTLSPFKQREFMEHIGGAKREATRVSRLEKCSILILKGKGLNDKYR